MTEDLDGAADRARGALWGLAIGDALGMPTQDLSLETIRGRYGVVEGFLAGPPDNAISAGLPAGRVTDDTDQALIVGRLLVAGGGHLDPVDLAHELLAWEDRMRAAGSLDLLGPSTRRALAIIREGGSIEEAGRFGDTNGAAMRITPVGLVGDVRGPDGVHALVERVVEVSRATHHTGLALSGAAAVAAGVSAGVNGASMDESIAVAVEAAELAAGQGNYATGAHVAARIGWACDLVRGQTPEGAIPVVSRLVGTSVATQESVPAALAFASLVTSADPWTVVRAAASVGGDCDTIAAMTGALCGAGSGTAAYLAEIRAELDAANPGLELDALADALLALRS